MHVSLQNYTTFRILLHQWGKKKKRKKKGSMFSFSFWVKSFLFIIFFSTFKLNVSYRRNCEFKVEDSERDLSAQFIDMDEQYFTPTMAKYQQEYTSKPRPVSMFSPRMVHISYCLKFLYQKKKLIATLLS